MTVINTTDTIREVGNGVKVAFTFPFKIFNANDLEVNKIDTSVSPEVPVLQVLGVDYTVAINVATEGGTVTYAVAPLLTPTSESSIARNLALTQTTDIPREANFPEESIENEFDKSRMIDIQQQTQIDQSIGFGPTSTVTGVFIPDPLADFILGWNAGGTQMINIDPNVVGAGSAAAAAASAAAAAASAAAASASAGAAAASAAAAAAEVVLAQAEVANAALEVGYAEEWAITPEDTLVSVAAGGDGATEYSALHWAAKAALEAAALNLPTPLTGQAGQGIIVNPGETGYIFSTVGSGTLVDDFTIKNNGGVIEVAPNLVSAIVVNRMGVLALGDINSGDFTDGVADTYGDQTGIDLGASSDQVFETGSYRTPIATIANPESLKILFEENGGNTGVVDSSGQGHTVTRNGNATLSPNHFKWGNGAVCLNGVDQYLTMPDSVDWDIMVSAATTHSFDCWFKIRDLSASSTFFSHGVDGNNNFYLNYFGTPGSTTSGLQFAMDTGGATVIATSEAGLITDNDWHHVYFLKEANEFSVWQDGIQIGYALDSDVQNTVSLFYIGARRGVSNLFNGYMDDVRLTNNNAFTAAPIPEPYLHLTLDDNLATTAVKDFGSGSNNGTTVGGNTSTFHADGKVRFGFDFDGTTDSINVDAAAVAINGDTTGTFCFWANHTKASTNEAFSVTDASADTLFRFFIADGVGVSIRATNVGSAILTVDSINGLVQNVWTHYAVVQDGAAIKIYVNGVDDTGVPSVGGTEWMSSLTTLDALTLGGQRSSGFGVNETFQGRLDDFRYYQNVALTQTQIQSIRTAGIAGVYGLGSPNITVPVAAHTDDANTLLLLPFSTTNQGDDLLDISTGGAGSPHTVTSVNGAGVTGKFESAYLSTVAAGDYLSIPDSTDFDFVGSSVGDKTYDTWFRFNSTTGDVNNDSYFVTQFQTAALVWQLSYRDTLGFRFLKNFGTNEDTGFVNPIDGDRDWHFLNISKIGIDYGLYLDGTQIGFLAVTNFGTTAAPLEFGRRSDIATSLFDGDTDGIHINNANLFSATPVAQPYIQLNMNDNLATTAVINTGSGANNGVATANTSTFSTTGKLPVGTPLGLLFDGISNGLRVDLDADIATIKPDAVGAFSMWVNPTALTSSLLFTMAHTANDTGFSIRMNISGQLAIGQQDTGPVTDLAVLTTGTALTTATWQHIVVTQDGVLIKYYLDGVLQTATITTGTGGEWFADMSAAADTMAVGGEQGAFSVTASFDGAIDDFRYYRHPLSLAQVTQIYNGGTGTEAFALDTITVPTTEAVADANSVLLLNCNSLDLANNKHIVNFNGGMTTLENFAPLSDLRGSLSLTPTQYLTSPDSTDWDLIDSIANSFTIDVWIKTTTLTGNQAIVYQAEDVNNWWGFRRVSVNGLSFTALSGGISVINVSQGADTMTIDTWHHAAVIKILDEYSLYLDGGQVAYSKDASVDNFIGQLRIGVNEVLANPFSGNMSDLRITDNNAFTATPTKTALLLVGEGVDEATTTTDISNFGHTVTFANGAKLDNAAPTGPKFNATTSLFFDGVNDELTIPASSAWDILENTTDDVTIDFWVNITTTTGDKAFYSQRVDTNNRIELTISSTVGFRFFSLNAGALNIDTGSAGLPALNVWSHIAMVKAGGSPNAEYGIYLNGIQVSHDSSSEAFTLASGVTIGRRNAADAISGYLEQFRITYGNIFGVTPDAGLISTITPPTGAITQANSFIADTITVPTTKHVADANTLLLAHFEPGILPGVNSGLPLDLFDYSTTPHTLTSVNQAYVTGAYKANTPSGRLRFDGIDDSITIPQHSDFQIMDNAKKDHTIHLWFRKRANSNTDAIMSVYEDANNYWALQHVPGANWLQFQVNIGGVLAITQNANYVEDLDLWHHYAFIKVGSEAAVGAKYGQYLDGNQIGYTEAPDIANFVSGLEIGTFGGGAPFDGDMDSIIIQPDATVFDDGMGEGIPNVAVNNTITVPIADPAGITTPGIMTIQSVDIVALASPDTIKIYFDLEDIDPTVVINTDFIVSVRRNTGDTHKLATLVTTVGAAPRRLVEATVDMTTETAGTDVSYLIQTANDIQSRIHAVTVLFD